MLEKLIHSQLSCHLEDNELQSDSQFGFRKQRSTSHAISQLLNQVYTNINKSTITAAIYIDFSKAFNCVQHSTLIKQENGATPPGKNLIAPEKSGMITFFQG